MGGHVWSLKQERFFSLWTLVTSTSLMWYQKLRWQSSWLAIANQKGNPQSSLIAKSYVELEVPTIQPQCKLLRSNNKNVHRWTNLHRGTNLVCSSKCHRRLQIAPREYTMILDYNTKGFLYVLKFVFAKFMFIQNGLAMKFQTCKVVQWY